MDRCWIGLGGNLGNVPETFAAAVAALRRRDDISDLTISPLYRSAPMGANAGDEFWNAIIGLKTSLEPLGLLRVLQELESRQGRVRSVTWGPRTLDLDVIYFGDRRLDTPELRLPHSGRICRRFVLDPLCDLAPQWIDPEYQMPVLEIRERLLRDPRRLILPPGLSDEIVSSMRREVQNRWPDVECLSGYPPTDHGLVIARTSSRVTPAVLLPESTPPTEAAQRILDAATAAFSPPQRITV